MPSVFISIIRVSLFALSNDSCCASPLFTEYILGMMIWCSVSSLSLTYISETTHSDVSALERLIIMICLDSSNSDQGAVRLNTRGMIFQLCLHPRGLDAHLSFVFSLSSILFECWVQTTEWFFYYFISQQFSQFEGVSFDAEAVFDCFPNLVSCICNVIY